MDTCFGEDGVVRYESGRLNYGIGVAIQQDGKILVVGYTSLDQWSWWMSDAVILRFK